MPETGDVERWRGGAPARTRRRPDMTAEQPARPVGAPSSAGRWLRLGTRVAFLGAAAAVSWVSLLPAAELPETHVSDKVEHLVAYGVLGLLGALGWAAGRATGWAEARAALAVCVGLVLLGVGLEVGQGYVPGRSTDPLDALANAAGAALAVAAVRLAARRRRR